MARQMELKDAVVEWPPRNAAAAGESPMVEAGDIITDANLSSGHLVVHLKRGVHGFTASTPLKGIRAKELQKIRSKTVGEAASMAVRVE